MPPSDSVLLEDKLRPPNAAPLTRCGAKHTPAVTTMREKV